MGLFVLRNTANSKNEGITSPKSSATYTITSDTPSGGFVALSSSRNENNYLEWSISTIYGFGFTFYMMNSTEYSTYIALAAPSRTRGNFAYTALLSDQEASASGIFYPPYSDTWYFVVTNHYTGFACSVDFFTTWNDDFFTIEEPTNSRFWEVNTSHYINWTWGGDFANVDIDLYHDGNFLRNIATNAQNNGSYFWRIPADISLFDDLYQVNISNTDFKGTWAINDPYFEITEKRSINVTRPSTSNSWETDTSEYINWTSTGFISNVMIELYNNDAFVMEITPNTLNDGDYLWAIPSGLGGSDQYQIKITDVSDPSVYNFSEYFEIFSFTITITNPDASSSWETDTSEYINWTSTGPISNVMIELYNNDVFVMEITPNTVNDGEYFWTIPSGLDGSDHYQIKITDVSDPTIYDFSEYFEIFSFIITITNPDASSSWETDTSEYINWTSTGPISNVIIELYNNDVFVMEITPNTVNDGKYYWTIPSGLDGSDQYQIKIIEVSDPSVYNFSEYFEIFSFTITLSNPVSESVWETDTSEYINWTSTGPISNVIIELYNNDAFVMEISPNTVNDGEYFWIIPSGLDGSDQYQIKITDVSDPTIYDFSEYFEIFSFTITITNPDASSSWETGASQYINWTSTGIISNVMIELYNNDTFVMEITPSTVNDGEYFWTIPSGLGESDQYQIKITDVSDPTIYNFSEYFKIMRPSSAEPPLILGYNLYILIGIIGVFSFILGKKRILK